MSEVTFCCQVLEKVIIQFACAGSVDDLEKKLSPKYMQLCSDIGEQAVLLCGLCLKPA